MSEIKVGVWERSASDIVGTLRQAIRDAAMSIDELAALANADRDEIVALLNKAAPPAPATTAQLAITLATVLTDRISSINEARRRSRASYTAKRLGLR